VRKAFSDTLMQLAAANPRIIFLTGDLGFQIFDDFAAQFGPRYINVGIAEAQLICASAGLAMEGWRPIAYSIASFITARDFEQIRISVCYPHLPVLIVGAGGGYTYADSGVTHHAADDLALMALLPGMTVVAPGDPTEVAQLLPQALQLPGPCYFRIGKYGEPVYQADEPVILGRVRRLRAGAKVAIISTGDLANVVLAAYAQLQAQGLNPAIYQMHTVKPLDTAALDECTTHFTALIVVEEQLPIGGLCPAIQAWAANRTSAPKVFRLGPPDAWALGNLARAELQRRWHYDADAIAAFCVNIWHTL
jgi:transketolase